MTTRDIQLALHSYLGQASLASNQQDLTRNLEAFSRDWKQEPTLEQFDTALGLLRDSRGSPRSETVSLWWMGFLQDVVLSNHIETYSPELRAALLSSVDPLADMIMAPSATVIKRALQVCATIHPIVFRICCQENVDHALLWGLWNGYAARIKQLAMNHFANPSEGIVLSLCKYIQAVIQSQSYNQPNSMSQDSEISSLGKIPENHPFLDANQLQQEADRHLRDLLSVIQRPSASSTIVTAIVNQTSALQRARPQFIPMILGTWMSFVRPSLPAHFTPLQARFVEKSIRIQLLAVSKMQLQPPQTQALSEALSHYGVRYNGGSLSRPQLQQLLHVDRDNGEESRRTGKRSRSTNNQESDDIDMKRMKPEPETGSSHALSAPAPAPGVPPAPSNIPPGFGQTLLGQLDITRLPIHHVVDIIFETLAANNVPHLFHSFLGTLPLMRLKDGPLPMPPPGVGPPPPGLLLQRPPPSLLPGMIPPHPGGLFPPPPHHLPHLGAGVPLPSLPEPASEIKPEIKQEVKREANFSKLQLPKIPDDVRVNITVRSPKHTPKQLPSRPVVVKSDTVTMITVPRKEGSPEKEVKLETKIEIEEQQRLLKQETFQVKTFEPSIERLGVTASMLPARTLLEQAFDRILSSEHLVSVPGASGRRMLDAAASNHRRSQQGSEMEDAVVSHESGGANQQTMVVTKADWMTIVARLLTRTFTRDSSTSSMSGEASSKGVKERMIDYICKDFRQRRELALTWLHEEWYYDGFCQRQSGDMEEREPQYLWCLYKILEGITTGATILDARDRGLSRFLLEVPELPDDAVDMLQKFCDDPARAQLGIGCLRDVVNLRPPSRSRALDILLDYTASPEKMQRSISIVTAKKWYLEHATVGPKVEEFALSQLETLKNYPVPTKLESNGMSIESASLKMDGVEDPMGRALARNADGMIKQEAMETTPSTAMDASTAPLTASRATSERALAEAEEDIGRLSELYFSLCAKNHSLLEVLLTHYSSYDPFVQRVVRQKIQPLIKSIKSDSTKLLALIRDFPMGAEMLVLRIIFILTDGVHPSANLVSTVQQAVIERDLNARFLIPIISGLDRGDVFACLPRIVSLLKGTERERRTVTDVFMKLLTGTGGSAGPTPSHPQPLGITRRDSSTGQTAPASGPQSQAQGQPGSSQARGPVMSPSELLVELHAMEDTVGWKAACEAMDICFNHPELYKSEIIAVVLQQLLDRPIIPSLFMRTVIQAITLYKNLVGFVNSMILAKLVQKKIWTKPVLWKGFVRCAKMMLPTSSSVLATLPKPQLKEVLAMEPMLKEPIDAYNKAKSSGRRVGGGAAKQINVHNAVNAAPVQPLPPPPPVVSDGAPDEVKKDPEEAMDGLEPPKNEVDNLLEPPSNA